MGTAFGAAWIAVLTLLVPLTARASESSQARLAQTTRALAGKNPVEVALAIWEAVELAPLVAGAPEAVAGQLEQLAKRSRLPWIPGEALIARARLLGASTPDALRPLAAEAGVLGSGSFLGPSPGSDVPDTLPATPDGASAKAWRPFHDADLGGTLPIADFLPAVGDLHVWVAFDLRADADAQATLVLGTNCNVAVWVDGAAITRWQGERPLTDWQSAGRLRFPRGEHRIVIGLGHASQAPELRVRLIGDDGRRPAHLQLITAPSAPGGKPAAAASVVEHGAPTLSALAIAPAELYGRFGVFVVDGPPADRAAPQALERAGGCTTAERCYLLGRAERTDESRARAAFEAADRLAHGHASALAALVALAERQGLPADADAFARRLAALEPNHPTALAHRVLRWMELADGAAALPILAADPRRTSNARLASLWASSLERAQQIPQAAAAWATLARLQLNQRAGDADDAIQRSATLYRRAGMTQAALAMLAEFARVRPYDVQIALLAARALAETDVAAAVQHLEGVRASYAESPALEETLGRLALVAGDRGKAIAAFDNALALAPQNQDLATYRRTLLATGGASDPEARTRDAVLEAAKAEPIAPQGAVYLVDRTRIEVFPSGLGSQLHQVAVRLDAKLATDRFTQWPFAFTPGEDRVEVLEAEVLRKDGTRLRPLSIDERRQDGKSQGVYTLDAYKVVTFPPLELGDIVHIQTRKDEIGQRNIFGDFFGVFLPLAAEFPKRDVSITIDAPAGRPLYHHAQGLGQGTPSQLPGGLQRIAWQADHIPAIPVEPSMPGYGDVGAWINIATFPDWMALARWYRTLVRPQIDVPADLRALVDTLVQGAPDVRTKVARIHAWVIKNTRYVGIEFGIHGFKPYKVAEIVKRGYGDCKDKASLLVALFGAAQIKAELVLVRTRDLGALDAQASPATLWAFNHAIAYVPDLGLYLDGTAELSGLGELPELDQGAQVLRIDLKGDGPPTLTTIPFQTAAENTTDATGRFTIAGNGDCTGTFVETNRGSGAASLRMRLQDPTVRDRLIGQVLAAQHPGAELIAARYRGMDQIGTPLTLEIDGRFPQLAQRTGQRLEVPLELDPGRRLNDLAPLTARQQPFVPDQLEHENSEDRYTLPAGAKVISLPAPVALDTPFGAFAIATQMDGAELVVKVTWELRAPRIAPADYPAFRAFLEAVARAESQRAVFEVPASTR